MTTCLTCQTIYSRPIPEAVPAIANPERYCTTSGRAVSMTPGDRCLVHGAADKPCTADIRPAQCQHEHLSPNHPWPHCSECGRDVPAQS